MTGAPGFRASFASRTWSTASYSASMSSRASSAALLVSATTAATGSPAKLTFPSYATSRILRWRLGGNFNSAHLLRGCLDRLYDVDIAGTPTKIPVDTPANLLVSRVGIPLQEEEARHQHSWGTVAALQSVVFPKSLLDWMKIFTPCQPLHGQDIRPFGLNREHHARLHGLAIHDYRASATMPSIAAYVRACEIQHISEEVNEQGPRLRRASVRISVHLASDPD